MNLLRNSYKSYLLHLPKYNSRNDKQAASIRKFIFDVCPALIGISLMSIDFQKAADLTFYIKETFPGIPIIWGGTHPTVSPEMSLMYADFVCIGEGEKVIIECTNRLSQRKSLDDVGNLAYMKSGNVMKNELYPLIDNLDEWFLFERNPPASYIEVKNSIIPVDNAVYKKNSRNKGITYNTMSSKGCPFSCTYCCNNFFNRLYKSKAIRRRSVAVVIEEIERAIKGDSTIKYINFLDDCFLACSREYLDEFCASYREKIGEPFIMRAIPTYIDREKIISLKQAGLTWVNLGLESGSDRTNKEIYKRGSSRKDFLRAARIINENKLASFYDVMLDNPFETQEDQIWTIKTIIETPKPFYPMMYSLTFFSGSEIYERALKECPERIDNPLYKNILGYSKSTINTLTRMAAFLSEKKMKKLLDKYQKGENGIGFKAGLLYYRLLSALIYEPLTYFRVVLLANNGSIPETVKELRYYFKSGIKKYLNQFFGPKIYSISRK
ncbi:MAG: hypothetical protein CVV39_09015 [Planctomycetes bacterium HGW-Planctomycetes-1]|nr:MAG: hypothetical protein CVV39_09015 [Planctomycetes bacterium HGW-Planctomycetes-1]